MKETLQKALDALGPTPPDCCGCQAEWQIAITAIKEALAQPEQDVGITRYADISVGKIIHNSPPPQRTWVGLTDKDWNRSKHNYDFQKGVDWAESILKEKNT